MDETHYGRQSLRSRNHNETMGVSREWKLLVVMMINKLETLRIRAGRLLLGLVHVSMLSSYANVDLHCRQSSHLTQQILIEVYTW